MEAFINLINVLQKDPQIRIKINDMLDRYNRLPLKNQMKIGYDALIRNVILKELINKTDGTITDLDIKLKMRISRIKYFEIKLL